MGQNLKLIRGIIRLLFGSISEFLNVCIYYFRIRIVKEGRKRKLIINDAKVTDGGMFSCTTNADKTEAELIIKCE